jgi:hypothetical protein
MHIVDSELLSFIVGEDAGSHTSPSLGWVISSSFYSSLSLSSSWGCMGIPKLISLSPSSCKTLVLSMTTSDEGMTYGSSILAYLVFGPRRVSIEGIARPTKMIAWCSPGARLDIQGKDSRRPS